MAGRFSGWVRVDTVDFDPESREASSDPEASRGEAQDYGWRMWQLSPRPAL